MADTIKAADGGYLFLTPSNLNIPKTILVDQCLI